MLISISASDARPIYVQIMDEVRRARVLGTIEPDDPLPSVRQLATELRVNPNTVQQAYRELEREGIVFVRRGQGTFIADSSVNGAQRRLLARGVAERALVDAHRNGVGLDELIAMLHEVAAGQSPPTTNPEKPI
ncbi:MAG TPA: GntR family transcriptional regulator [Longimicrobiaceae bacterium]|nr:GntR family transcriptional regulator [Longimicrobiaceae bacterium]